MEFLIRFAQVHETFRRPEIQALATLAGINVEFLFYDQYVCSMFSLMKKNEIDTLSLYFLYLRFIVVFSCDTPLDSLHFLLSYHLAAKSKALTPL